MICHKTEDSEAMKSSECIYGAFDLESNWKPAFNEMNADILLNSVAFVNH